MKDMKEFEKRFIKAMKQERWLYGIIGLITGVILGEVVIWIGVILLAVYLIYKLKGDKDEKKDN